ncbi:MAG TPA: transposase [Roseiarcus sp.]|nr:transposase [Roseiarcus sp.]
MKSVANSACVNSVGQSLPRGLAKHPAREKAAARASPIREKIKARGHDSPYRLRKQLPEPVFGQIKQAPAFRHVPAARRRQVAGEWGFVCVDQNILKPA